MMDRFILEALQKAVTTAAGGLPVKYVGRNIDPPSDGKWWELVFIPNNITGEFIDDSKTYRGFMRVILHWPQDDRGAYEMMEKATTFAAFFAKGSRFKDPANSVLISITDNVNMGSPIEEPPQVLLPLTIRYLYFKV